jgi:hypothetical protein
MWLGFGIRAMPDSLSLEVCLNINIQEITFKWSDVFAGNLRSIATPAEWIDQGMISIVEC